MKPAAGGLHRREWKVLKSFFLFFFMKVEVGDGYTKLFSAVFSKICYIQCYLSDQYYQHGAKCRAHGQWQNISLFSQFKWRLPNYFTLAFGLTT